jgi:hypothetical protein
VNTAPVYLFAAGVENMADHDPVIDRRWRTGAVALLLMD